MSRRRRASIGDQHAHVLPSQPDDPELSDLLSGAGDRAASDRLLERPAFEPAAHRLDHDSARARQMRRSAAGSRTAGGLKVRRLARGAEDGYRSRLVPGLRSSTDAERLAEELAFATARLRGSEQNPPGPVRRGRRAAAQDVEERTWLAFLIAYLGPLDGEDPFRAIAAARTTWASGEQPAARRGRSSDRGRAHDADARDADDRRLPGLGRSEPARRLAAFTGESAWPPERRFERVFERMALPGLAPRRALRPARDARPSRACYELEAGALQLGGENEVTVAAKRILGIGDPLLLERARARARRRVRDPARGTRRRVSTTGVAANARRSGSARTPSPIRTRSSPRSTRSGSERFGLGSAQLW